MLKLPLLSQKTLAVCVIIALLTNIADTKWIAHAQSAPSASSQSDEYLFDPFDPFDFGESGLLSSEQDDEKKSAEQLLLEATQLLMSEHLLDARTKLLRALKKDPKNYRTYYTLAGYYLVHVGHFRLALKYIQRAEQLFIEQHGPPPYLDPVQQMEHANILYYQSQIRLNLDNYKGALQSLDTFESLGYMANWYPGSRAWILMKLGRLKEAIAVARAGVLTGAEPGRTLNMLGILLSMSGEPQEALKVFKQAIGTEFALGNAGQPATPLNNAGEVYKELFEDDKAESAFLRATSIPDGCEHVLPSLNLVLLYIDQLKLQSAASTLDGFERCIAQYPLRNSEEHSALVHLARGRIDLHSGHIDRAIRHFREAIEGTQWFGKIGTNQDDLVVATSISLAQALRIKNNILSLQVSDGVFAWLHIQKERMQNSVEAWWKLRKARQILVSTLNSIEDLSIRNTDSLLEYPTLGEVLAEIATVSFKERLASELRIDSRPQAALYYALYAAENRLGWFNANEIKRELDTVIARVRQRYDALLRLHALIKRLSLQNKNIEGYYADAYAIFTTNSPALRNYGFSLPITLSKVPSEIASAVLKGPFVVAHSSNQTKPQPCEITAPSSQELSFRCPSMPQHNRTVKDGDPIQLVNKLIEAIFTEEIRNGSSRT